MHSSRKEKTGSNIGYTLVGRCYRAVQKAEQVGATAQMTFWLRGTGAYFRFRGERISQVTR